MYCIDAQNNARSVAPDYVALEGEVLCPELPEAMRQTVAAIEGKALRGRAHVVRPSR